MEDPTLSLRRALWKGDDGYAPLRERLVTAYVPPLARLAPLPRLGVAAARRTITGAGHSVMIKSPDGGLETLSRQVVAGSDLYLIHADQAAAQSALRQKRLCQGLGEVRSRRCRRELGPRSVSRCSERLAPADSLEAELGSELSIANGGAKARRADIESWDSRPTVGLPTVFADQVCV